MEETLKQILNELKETRIDINELKQGQNTLETGLKETRIDINELKQGQSKLQAGQEKLQKNLVDSLGLYTNKIIDHFDDKTEVLNKRVYKVETEIERLNR